MSIVPGIEAIAGREGLTPERGSLLASHPHPLAPDPRFDYDKGVTPGSRFECTCVVELDPAGAGNKLIFKGKAKGGSGEEAWEAKRHALSASVPREDGKIKSFSFKDPAIFARVTDNLVEKKAAWVEKARESALGESISRQFFDGALEYIPGPGCVGSEYMTQHEVDRFLAKREEGHRARVIAAFEAKIEALKTKVAGGADDLKGKLEITEKLLKGEHGAEKLKERPPFKPALSGFEPKHEKPERKPDEYATIHEVMRALDKADRERNKKELAAAEEALPKHEAALAAGVGDADKLKLAVEHTKRMIKGLKGLIVMGERPKFKPNSLDVQLASAKPAEHMPVRSDACRSLCFFFRFNYLSLTSHPRPRPRPQDVYMSAFELERKLKSEEAAWQVKHTEKLEAEAARLAAKAAAAPLDDMQKRRSEIVTKLIKGEKSAAKLVERKKFRSGSGDATASRFSSSVMLNKVNIRKML